MVVHVFILDVASIVKYEPHFFSLLNSHQQAFYKAKTQKRKKQYLFSRILLRYALSYCTNQPVDAVDIVEPESGKPESIFAQKNNLRFGLSHCGNLYSVAVVGGVNDKNVGIDIECLRPIRNEESVLFFCNDRQVDEFYRLVGDGERSHYYYQLWTQKEALLKATEGSIFSDTLKKSHFLDVVSQPYKETDYFVKTAFLDEAYFLSDQAYLSVCSKSQFELQVSRVLFDEPALDFRHELLQVNSKSFVSAIDQ